MADLRRPALRILKAALRAADPGAAIRASVARRGGLLIVGGRRYSLSRFDRVLVLGAGKASAAMAAALEPLFAGKRVEGLLSIRDVPKRKPRRIAVELAGHPMPDVRGQAAAERIAALARSAGPRDLVICLISGGASALLPLPAPGLTIEDKQAATRLLLACGATIHEINAVRKHLSAIKGGQLARLAAPAPVVSLLLSDVPGDDLDVIGSGPTVPDRSTFAEAVAILKRYGVWEQAPSAVRKRLEQGGEETPKPGDPVFRHVQNTVIGSNRLALAAAATEAKRLGFRPLVLSSRIEGESREVAFVHAAIALDIQSGDGAVKPPACLLSGGETTVTLRGDGKGGRNQEFTLAAAIALRGTQGILACSVGTDGSDGPTDAAGAWADGETFARAASQGLDARDHLARNDSYPFFDALGDLVRTGPTGTNVMDVRLMLVR
jgi:hydroxypyruvate reductase